MPELLSRQSPIPVRSISEITLIEPNVVYVRPPKVEIEIVGANLVPTERISEGPEALYSIDRFFISLAGQRREKSIGIILSGMGTDGSRGVNVIREYGGLILVQDPASAQFTGMPNSAIRRDLADLVGPPEKLARSLIEIVHLENELEYEGGDDNITNNTLARQLIELIHEQVGLDFTQYRPNTIRRRIEKRMLIAQIKSNREYLALVRSDVEECRTLAKSFLIGVTRFFRDPDAFEFIREKVIPRIFAEADYNRPVRVWVPSCSTGEEAYTLAILLDEYRRAHAKDVDFKILASDIDTGAVKSANHGMYAENITADVPEKYLSRYFVPIMGGYQVVPHLKDRILFAVRDLIHDPPFIKTDLISCRNFLIYVNIEAQSQVLSSFHFALNANGYLMLGPSESLGKLQNAFSVINRRWKIYTRRPHDSLPLPSITRTRIENSTTGTKHLVTTGSVNLGGFTDSNSSDLLSPPTSFDNTPMVRDPFAQYLADRYAPTTLFVNEEYDIVYINGDVDGLLHFPRHHARFNLKRVLDSEVSTVLCSAVDGVLINDDTDDYREVTIPDVKFQDNTYSVRVQSLELSDRPRGVVAIVLNHSPEAGGDDDEEGAGRSTSSEELIRRRIQTLEEQLLQSNIKTQKLLSELEATNEELQTSNRELLASNEEMQSTNEELQSVNEELYTVNNEVQSKNEQLKLLNSDINHLLGSTEIGTIFLDSDMTIRRFTPMIRKQFDLHASDVGRPISSFSSSFTNLDLVGKCQKVVDDGFRIEEEIIDDGGQDFLLRILPYQALDGTDAGLVVTFIDIGDLVDTRKRLQDMATKYEALLKHSEDSIAIVGSNGKIQEINKWVETDHTLESLIGTYFSDLIEKDSQRVIFDRSLRGVFDNRSASQIQLTLRGNSPSGVHLDMAFIPTNQGTGTDRKQEPQVMIIIRDISEQVRNEHHTSTIIQNYQEQLDTQNVQGGLISVDGTIIYLNRSTEPGASVEKFVQHNVQDFLTDTGKQKFRGAIDRIVNGSFIEDVHYSSDDLEVAPAGEDGTKVVYRPIIADGEIRLIGITARP